MENQVFNLTCPGCGAPVSTGDTVCQYCSRPVIIRTFNSVHSMTLSELNKRTVAYSKSISENPDNSALILSAAFCYLKLKNYDKALLCFEKAIEIDFDNTEAYFYAAIALLKGKRAFLSSKDDIKKAEEYLNSAIMIEPKGIYCYLWAYIRYDHHFRKFFKVTPDYKELLSKAVRAGLSQTDKKELFEILDVEKPSEL